MFPQKIYFIAIAGTGMSALAGLFQSRGAQVSGSDVACYSPVKEILESMKIEAHIGYDLDHLKAFNPDFVVIGNFVRKDNPQAQYVMEAGIPYSSFPGALEKFFLQETYNLVVTGTHGKSTTSTALAHILNQQGLNPSYLIGALPFDLPSSFHVGEGEAFVLEGDEYDTAFFDKESKFLHYRPNLMIWTSLEFDHADIFSGLSRIELMFRKLLALLPEEGQLIYCADYPRIKEIIIEEKPRLQIQKNISSYGFDSSADYRIQSYQESSEGIEFECAGQKFSAKLPGRFNALNLAAAGLAAKAFGMKLPEISESIQRFRGLRRRQELRFEKQGRRIFDDFAHHPSSVKAVTEAIKARFPDEHLIVVFEARSNTTRRSFFQQSFVEAFAAANEVVLAEVFKLESLDPNDRLDVPLLVSELRTKGLIAEGPLKPEEIVNFLALKLKSRPANVLILSNGAFDNIHEKLISRLEALSFSA